MKNALLAETLTRIRDDPMDMYDPNSTLVQDILDDIGPGHVYSSYIITARKQSCGKVMFSQVSVILVRG